MAEVVILGPGQVIDPRQLSAENDNRTIEERIAAIERMNPRIRGNVTRTSGYTPILLTDPTDNEQICRANFGAIEAEYRALSPGAKITLDEVGLDESLVLLEALEEFKRDHMPSDEVMGTIGDMNTVAGGVVSASALRTAKVADQMRLIEGLLKQYASAPGNERHLLKPVIKEAYKVLNKNFKTVLDTYILKVAAGRGGIITNSKVGMKSALRGRTALTSLSKTKPLIRAANGFRYVSKGVFLLDVGLRGYNVAGSDNKLRTGMAEFTGWGASTYFALTASTFAVSLALGPLGWLIAIVLIGAGAYLMDQAGKAVGSSLYDGGAYIYDGAMQLAY